MMAEGSEVTDGSSEEREARKEELREQLRGIYRASWRVSANIGAIGYLSRQNPNQYDKPRVTAGSFDPHHPWTKYMFGATSPEDANRRYDLALKSEEGAPSVIIFFGDPMHTPSGRELQVKRNRLPQFYSETNFTYSDIRLWKGSVGVDLVEDDASAKGWQSFRSNVEDLDLFGESSNEDLLARLEGMSQVLDGATGLLAPDFEIESPYLDYAMSSMDE